MAEGALAQNDRRITSATPTTSICGRSAASIRRLGESTREGESVHLSTPLPQPAGKGTQLLRQALLALIGVASDTVFTSAP